MPTERFFRLNEEKKNKIMEAARLEFSLNSFHDAAISNIIKTAGIARGSFYQYFEDKEDLFLYCVMLTQNELEEIFDTLYQENHGDLVTAFELFFDQFVEEVYHGKNAKFLKNLLVYMDYRVSHKVFSEERLKSMKEQKHHIQKATFESLYKHLNHNLINVDSYDDFIVLFRMVSSIIFVSINEGFRDEMISGSVDTEKVKASFKKKLNWLKFGVLKGVKD
ncbi:TetR/AcrR family transcriptional regulator [Vagococcus silagei]|nr:TetR/AcrR family transcriptional regulator [Vagococcus silagei]